jgi:hypothetical protein
MNPIGKKLISLFLVFSLMMLSMNLYAKERRGAKLIVTKKDGQQIEGELITVKLTSLLLLDTKGKDVSVDIEDIKVIRVIKKSKALLGAGLGLAVGGGIGALIGLSTDDGTGWLYSGSLTTVFALTFGILGIPIGALLGAIAGTDKTIKIEGMTDSEIQEALDYLRKKARVRDYK